MPITREERLAQQRAYARRRYWANRERELANAKRYRQENREKLNARNKLWRRNNREKELARYRRRHLADPGRNTRVKLKAYEAEAGRPRPEHCEVCGGNTGGITFDHCHQRGIFRGWLCSSCNAILGYARDDPTRLLMLAAYLKRTAVLVAPQLTLPGL